MKTLCIVASAVWLLNAIAAWALYHSQVYFGGETLLRHAEIQLCVAAFGAPFVFILWFLDAANRDLQ